MKATLIGYEIVKDYKNAKGEAKKGGFKLYFASTEAFPKNAQAENLYNGLCPLKNNYWVGRESRILDTNDLLKRSLPIQCELDFNYQGYLNNIEFKK